MISGIHKPGNIRSIYFAVVLAGFLFSCGGSGNESDDTVVATAFDKTLYQSDLDALFGPGMSKEDSMLVGKGFIDNWIKKQVILEYANQSDIGSTEEINRKVEAYREDLIAYEYRKKMLLEKLDTNITFEESKAYYEAHPENFELKQNIIRFVFIKMPIQLENKYHYWIKFGKADGEELADMAVMALKNGGNAFIESEKWVAFDDILKVVPINTYNQESFINNNRLFKIDEANFVWYIHIKDFMIRDNISPFDFVKDNIHEILLNKRKLKIMEEIERQMVLKAYKKNKVKVNAGLYGK